MRGYPVYMGSGICPFWLKCSHVNTMYKLPVREWQD